MNDRALSDSFYNTVDTYIQLLGAERVSETDIFFRISRAANGSGVDYSEIRRILAEIKSFAKWFDAWKKSAEHYLELGARAEKQGRLLSAGEHYLRASLLYHFAQLFTRPEDPHRKEGQQKRVEYFQKACPHLSPAIEPVSIPYQGGQMPGYLRLPKGANLPAVVLMIPGANSVKEELHHWGLEFNRRGLATLAFDGPGQGELSFRSGGPALRLENFHEAVSATIDYLHTRPEVNPRAIIAWGQSTGGQLAMRAAASDKRIRAAVSLGGGYDFRMEITPMTPADVWEEARDLYGFSTFSQAEDYVREHGSLKGILQGMRCPLLLVHGGLDNIVSMDEIELIRREVAGPVTVMIYPDGNHSVCNRNIEMTAEMADWIMEQAAGMSALSERREDCITAWQNPHDCAWSRWLCLYKGV